MRTGAIGQLVHIASILRYLAVVICLDVGSFGRASLVIPGMFLVLIVYLIDVEDVLCSWFVLYLVLLAPFEKSLGC